MLLALCCLPRPANPTVNSCTGESACSSGVFLNGSSLWEGLEDASGRAELLDWKRSKERVCGVESGNDGFNGSDKPLAWLSC